MQVTQITLLTIQEYNEHKSLIPNIHKSWWLQDRGPHGHPGIVSFIDAEVFDGAYFAGERFVRPALRITDVNLKPGDKVAIFAYSWTVLSATEECTLVLCDEAVTLRPYDSVDRSWQESELRIWLERWLAKRLKTDNHNNHRRYKCMNTWGMKYLCNSFLKDWLTPMSLMLPISAVMAKGTWMMGDFWMAPSWLQVVVMSFAMIVAFMSLATTLLVIFSSHVDTGLRHVLNTAFIITVMVLLWNNLTLFGLTCIMSATALAGINHRYLQIIKYHS